MARATDLGSDDNIVTVTAVITANKPCTVLGVSYSSQEPDFIDEETRLREVTQHAHSHTANM